MKLNDIIYNKLLLQAEEAKQQGLTKLASVILYTINQPPDQVQEYSYTQLTDDVYSDMWKVASKLMVYYDVTGVNAGNINLTIKDLVKKALLEIENVLDVSSADKTPLEPLVPGEDE